MRVNDFDFDLPKERIALRPASPRESARLLVVRAPEAPSSPAPPFEDWRIGDLPALLRPGDVLVFNDTKVIPAQLRVRRVGRGEGGGVIGVTLHKRVDASRWLAFARPARRLAPGGRVAVLPSDENPSAHSTAPGLAARVEEKGEGGEILFAFEASGAELDAAIAALGQPPLPPYIASQRPADAGDRRDYQTVFARRDGAVAAPTAGLHFTETLLARLASAGARSEFVTLHVGAGTFLPVKAEDTRDHKMHAEWGEVPPGVAGRLNAARAEGARVISVGTTSLRLLESAARADGRIGPFSGETDIFVTPGSPIRAADALLTNFHLPRSTLFMLVAAFSRLDVMQQAYGHAISNGYRFYSYGDACLLERFPQRERG
jgi:S-adenosylmethionine:tRNA ribosyltransferase-isomerase